LKIALIRKNYGSYGGAENYLRLVSEGLRAQGHEVHIFSASHHYENSYRIHKVRTIKKPSFLSNIFFALNVKNALKKASFDGILSFERIFLKGIHTAGKKALPATAGYPAWYPKLPNGVYRAGDGCHREWLSKRKMVEPFFKKLSFILNPHHLTLLYLEKQCLLGSKTIIANSMMVKKDIMRYYSIPEEKIRVVYNGVNLQRFHPVGKEQKTAIKNSLGIKEDRVILFVGADFKRKGLVTLFRAFSLLGAKGVKLIVAGSAGKKRYLSMAEKLGIDKNVVFWGTEKEVEKLYFIADIFVLPTLYDPFSNATLEAMASGLPVVTTAHNGASELVEDGIEGFVIDNSLNVDAFAEKISIALLQAEDMGRKARIKAEDYSIERAIGEIIRVISEDG